MTPYLFIGLGNPGDQYTNTRHNAGWLVIDALVSLWSDQTIPARWHSEKKLWAESLKLNHENHEVIFLKPQTFMNDSGKTAQAAAKWFLNMEIESADEDFPRLVIFHDDLDLPLGTYKLQYNSGPKIHNGLNSVRQHLHSTKFWVVRIGVDTRQGDRTLPGQAYVLQPLTTEEKQNLKKIAQTLSEELPYTVLQ